MLPLSGKAISRLAKPKAGPAHKKKVEREGRNYSTPVFVI